MGYDYYVSWAARSRLRIEGAPAISANPFRFFPARYPFGYSVSADSCRPEDESTGGAGWGDPSARRLTRYGQTGRE